MQWIRRGIRVPGPDRAVLARRGDRRPSGLHATADTRSPWPFRMRGSPAPSSSQTRTRLVVAGRGEPAAVRTPREPTHRTGMTVQHPERTAVAGVPDANGRVRAPRGDQAPVGAPRHGLDSPLVAEELSRRGVAVRFPDAHGGVVVRGREPVAVGAPGQAMRDVGQDTPGPDGRLADRGLLARRPGACDGWAAGLGGPDPDGPVAVASGGDPGRIRAPGHAVHRRGVGMPRGKLAAVGRVPDAERHVGSSGGDPAPVGAAGDRPHAARMGRPRPQLAATARVPDPDPAVGAARDDPGPIPAPRDRRDGLAAAAEDRSRRGASAR